MCYSADQSGSQMTYEEAMGIVDKGGIVSQERYWVMRAAGFAWGPWVQRMRRFTAGDLHKQVERHSAWTPENLLAPVEASGDWCRSYNTLCESVEITDASAGAPLRSATDWIDVTDRFDGGSPKGYLAYFRGGVICSGL